MAWPSVPNSTPQTNDNPRNIPPQGRATNHDSPGLLVTNNYSKTTVEDYICVKTTPKQFKYYTIQSQRKNHHQDHKKNQ